MNKIAIVMIIASMCLLGCMKQTPYVTQHSPHELDNDYVGVGYAVADALEMNLRHTISKDQPIIVASFVNIDDLTQSSTLGRMIADHVASRLAQRGYSVIEVKLRQSSIFIQEGKGEFMLSRDIRELSRTHNAGAVVVGTYGETRQKTYVAARMVRSDDSLVLSSCDYSMRNLR